jgi:hypothetical protein
MSAHVYSQAAIRRDGNLLGQQDESAQTDSLANRVIDPVGLHIQPARQEDAGGEGDLSGNAPWRFTNERPGEYRVLCSGRFEMTVSRWNLESAAARLVAALNENFALKRRLEALETQAGGDHDQPNGH